MPHPTTKPLPRSLDVFSEFLLSRPVPSALRDALSAARCRPEAECVAALMADATPDGEQALQVSDLARRLSLQMRERDPGALESLMQAFPLGSAEGQSLLRLAEALLRIPDTATQDALIRDQVGKGDWARNIGRDKSLLVNAAAKGMSLAGRLTASKGFSLRSLTSLTSAPMIRRAMDRTIRMMGSQFVPGENIHAALKASREQAARGFTFSYDMLGESALTATDASAFLERCEQALEALGQHAGVSGTIHERPSLSLKLSGLHPRFSRTKRARIMDELLPVLQRLAIRARHLDIGLMIDAEESERLDIALDVFEALCTLPELEGWNGLGFALQAYNRCAPELLNILIDIGARTHRRIMVRLVKGAYWNREIRRAQVEGLDFPVFTRKCHTDLSYLACARRMLSAPAEIYPQFATHNAQTIAHIHTIAGPFQAGRYEFQCLHGMAETLSREVLSPSGLDVPCRVYVPVGTYETLLGYLLRRFVENGASSSFINQVASQAVSVEALIVDPVRAARAIPASECANPSIRAPSDLFEPGHRNSAGFDITDEQTLRSFETSIDRAGPVYRLEPITPDAPAPTRRPRILYNPAERNDRVAEVVEADGETLTAALLSAEQGLTAWSLQSPEQRTRVLDRTADLMEAASFELLALLIREAGKTLSSAVRELREAVDLLRYDAERLRGRDHRVQVAPLGIVACLSPWNAPLSVFTGQVASALAAGNAVIAKPAEQTPMIAARATQILHDAGVPPEALHMLPGDAALGTALVEDMRVDAVMFTGATAAAKDLSRRLFGRVGRTGLPVQLITQTSAQNAMLVDSSALPEQAIRDIISSAFDSSGQNCAALRILLVQEDCADAFLERLRGAMRELSIGNPARLLTDIGPVISSEAQAEIEDHIDRMRRAGRPIWSLEPGETCRHGHFVAPTLIEIGRVADISNEVFGPVLHIRRYARSELDGVIDAVNATGYGLAFGIQSRLSSTIDRAVARSTAGNIYVNRGLLGAVAGSRPVGGHGLSGTGPKMGGPFALRRMSAQVNPWHVPKGATTASMIPHAARSLVTFLESRDAVSARRIRQDISHGMVGLTMTLPAPSGETETYSLVPGGPVLCAGDSWPAILRAVGMALGTGNVALVLGPDHAVEWMSRLSAGLKDWVQRVDPGALPECSTMLMEADSPLAQQAASTLTAREGRIVPIHTLDSVRPEWLMKERLVSINTAAVAGDLRLMAVS
ncbi:bifunctional proline dehydrogenase/L-glutamate gamma-semialdehyde dehydrogenase PutA [Gluconobacter wancherniae]|uniref:bifunctional proline dehydrogenase/L-glutamate gamma-semialdehyde dehydrogenase PutA n=1 Tax=Gluconobacter wancherniae TaxID=1307955 RepID=UPI001B8C5EF5|nr:bifunctional proline dehydrogenase/L-glutamate gamma-semialdehyde dehydrogenase PutA [Gluconobacter wancherniae]MBS1062646.1 bifunctional proline dehydrogenase/L-glutamate gamma-semialdehyde dehydrogenase PutA [Gluconobacter wancherniae]